LVDALKKRLAERMHNAERDRHRGTAAEQAAGNHRNGDSGQTVLTDTGKLELAIPRDRHGRFDRCRSARTDGASRVSTTRSSRGTRAA
jgi:putative transposase